MAFAAGDLLTTTPGAWTNTGAVLTDVNGQVVLLDGVVVVDESSNGNESIAWQWRTAEDGSGTGAADISLATAQTYQTLEAQDGSYIGTTTTLDNGSDSATANSIWTLLGTMYSVGETLTTTPGTWTNLGDIDNTDGIPGLTVSNTVTVNGGSAPSGTEAISWQWYRADDASGTNAAAISGATSRNYTLASGDVGKWIAVGVSINNGADEAEQLSSYVGDVQDTTPTVPVIVSPADGTNYNLAENATTALVTVSVTGNPAPTLSLSGTDAAYFQIVGGTVSAIAGLDYETPQDSGGNNVYNLSIVATNSEGSDTTPITVTITNVEDLAPTIGFPTAGSNFNYPANGTADVLTATATADALSTIVWSVTGTDAALFSITDGVLTFDAAPTEAATLSINIVATTDIGSDTHAITITVTEATAEGGVVFSPVFSPIVATIGSPFSR